MNRNLRMVVWLRRLLEGSLTEGWDFRAQDGQILHLFTDGEIFGWRRPEPRRRARQFAEAPEANYSDLQSGDYVVHTDHGIGRFSGLVRRTVDGVEREYLCVEYADEAQLYVPVHQSDRLTRYVGPDNRAPTLSRLGSPEWRGVKTLCQGSRPRCGRGSARAVCQTQRGAGFCLPARLRLATGAGSQLPLHRDRRPDARAGGSEARYASRRDRWTV